VLKPDAVPDDQPVIIRYEGATVHKQISAYYEGGLEYAVSAQTCSVENLALRFLAADPYWYEIGQSAAVLDNNDALTTRYVAARLMSTGQWSALGLGANPTTNGTVYAVLIASDKSVYIGGDFVGWGGVHGRDYVARYVPGTGWTTVGADHDFKNVVYALAEGPTGLVYAGGAFHVAVEGSTCDYLGVWDAAAWATVGVPFVAGHSVITNVRALAFDHSGNLYIGGAFVDWADVHLADCLVRWDGTTYAAVGTFAGSSTLVCIYTISIGIDNTTGIDYIAVGGDFTDLAGNADSDYAAWCPGFGSVWRAINYTPFNGIVYKMVHTHDNTVYIGGAFTAVAGIADANYIVGYKGYEGEVFFALGDGVTDTVRSIHIAADGRIWVGGDFLQAGTLTNATYFAVWNGSSWELPDLVLNASSVYAIDTGVPDPIVAQNYDVWIGFDFSGASAIAGTATVTNDGTENAYPTIYVYATNVGFAGPASRLIQIRNETTGKTLHFNYSLLLGELLTIDLRLAHKAITSSFWGRRALAILPSSDLGTFCLQPGANQLTCAVDIGAKAPTVHLLYSDSYWSLD
jgi:hypothetical protein